MCSICLFEEEVEVQGGVGEGEGGVGEGED